MVMNKDWGYLASAIFFTLKSEPLLGTIAVLGVAGWARRSFRCRDTVSLAGAGILAGVAVHCFWIRFHLEQYQTPVYVTLALFAPFAFCLFGENAASRGVKAALSLAALVAVIVQVPAVNGELDRTVMNLRGAGGRGVEWGPPCVEVLSYYDKLLEVIPREDKIAVVWYNNPMFRRDITGALGDDRPSFAELIPADDPLHRFFEEEYLKAELRKTPPALIDFFKLTDNYPPGWEAIIYDYVKENRVNYRVVTSPVDSRIKLALRADLADKWTAAFPYLPAYPLNP
jgi:hypothetical protein